MSTQTIWEQPMSEEAAETQETQETQEQQQERTFSQADVDRIVKDRLTQQAKNQFGDYADLKKRASEKATADERIAELEKKYADAEAARLRSDIAANFKISKEDRDLFLTGNDEATLTAQAERLAEREKDRQKQGNVARTEGTTRTTGDRDADTAEFARSFFGGQ